ncbi:hypothetical protein WJX73_006459 [Symbiochloris irregularis]|uniref:Selenoprotein H n=1 Tax=Symbiochloris irregularis TaxID=706552 RepID=A0AAW1PRW8_9CHLO
MAPKRKAKPEAKASPAKKAKPAKAAKATKTTKAKPAPKAEKEQAPSSDDSELTLVVEHCKQCQCFKRRTAELEQILREQVPDLDWTVNPEKPRRGCFEVRDANSGKKYITLLDMPRPFSKLKELDMDDVAEKILTAQ